MEKDPKILISDSVSTALLEGLKKDGFSYDYKPDISREDLLGIIGNYNIIVVRSRTKLDSEILEKASRLKIIARAGIGVDNIDIGQAESRNIEVMTTKSAPTQSVVELNVGLAINLARKVTFLNSRMKNGDFNKQKGNEINGSTCGVVGFGRIGYETATMLRALGADIVAYDIVHNDELIRKVSGEYVSLNELMERSNFIFVCVTLNDSSKGLIGSEALLKVKKDAFVINTSRAEAIEHEALLRALKDGSLSGYAADVMWNEPPSEEWEKDMISMDNVVITPHIGSQTFGAQERVAEATLENIRKAVRGNS